jgi:RNA polymerase sigma-70 factor (ECF subfamily)
MLTLTGLFKQDITSRAGEARSAAGAADETLISAIAAGDRCAMQALYARHNVRVYRFVLRLSGDSSLAEDIVADVFLEVWRRADGFRAKSRVSTWILAIARYKTLSVLRRRSEEHLDERAATSIVDPADDSEAMLCRQDRSAIVRKCLSQLSAIHREVLDLVYYHDKSVEEVAQIVGVSANTAKTRMFYARQRMENLLAAAGVGAY